jgi:hypothetical protein
LKSLKKILSSRSPELHQLMQRVGVLQQLNKRLTHLLSPPLSQHCSIAAVEQDTLVIVTTSAAWATRLRMQSSKIVKDFQEELHIKSVSVQIQPAKTPVKSPGTEQKKPPRMSSQTSNLLIKLAETTSDPKLSHALRRLSQRPQKQR